MVRRKLSWSLVAVGLLLGGCARPAFQSQSITTNGPVRLDIALSDGSTVKTLFASLPDGARHGDPKQTKQAGILALSLVSSAPAEVSYDSSGVPLISSGWIYIVRPPAWPMVRTPSTRGGPPSGDEWTGLAYIGASVDNDVQRIFFLGAFDENGKEYAGARIKVDDYPAHPSHPDDCWLNVGDYAEAHFEGAALIIKRSPFNVLEGNYPDDIRALMIQMQEYAQQHNLPWNSGIQVAVPP